MGQKPKTSKPCRSAGPDGWCWKPVPSLSGLLSALECLALQAFLTLSLRFAITMINSFIFCVILCAITEAPRNLLHIRESISCSVRRASVLVALTVSLYPFVRCQTSVLYVDVDLQHRGTSSCLSATVPQGRKFGTFLKLASSNNVARTPGRSASALTDSSRKPRNFQ